MAWDVQISVAFECLDLLALMELASSTQLGEDASLEALYFLQDCKIGRGFVEGPKGGLYTWGCVFNGDRRAQFVEDLRPFWESLLSSEGGACLDFHHILVFGEAEQSDAAQCWEIYREPLGSLGKYGDLKIVHHEDLPFKWNQC